MKRRVKRRYVTWAKSIYPFVFRVTAQWKDIRIGMRLAWDVKYVEFNLDLLVLHLGVSLVP